MFSFTYKVAFENISIVEQEEIFWEGEKRLQGHLLCPGLAQAETGHRILVVHFRKKRVWELEDKRWH